MSLRSEIKLIPVLWAFLGMPAFCMSGVFEHACDCGHDDGCSHESDCERDPCRLVISREDDADSSHVVHSMIEVVLIGDSSPTDHAVRIAFGRLPLVPFLSVSPPRDAEIIRATVLRI